MEQKYFRMVDWKVEPGLVCKQDVTKGEDLNQKLMISK